MPDTIEALLVACGETEWDAGGRLLGAADVPLTSAGREGVLASLERLDELDLGLVLAAPDEACGEAAGLIADRAECKVRTLSGLVEPTAGLWEGMSREALAAKCTHAFSTWLEDPGLVVPPQGEGLAEAEQRVLGSLSAALDRVKTSRRAGGARVAIVLRPMALGIVLCWQQSAGSDRLWSLSSAHRAAGGMSWATLDRERLRRTQQDVRASA
ncbi:MAG: histidine phosphatase family protein [Phycisphaerales bacterium]|jgi:broad specificity phosphatase PhoE|nr:histidine phosphatase family protein [Phycisphaerales bacterium]